MKRDTSAAITVGRCSSCTYKTGYSLASKGLSQAMPGISTPTIHCWHSLGQELLCEHCAELFLGATERTLLLPEATQGLLYEIECSSDVLAPTGPADLGHQHSTCSKCRCSDDPMA